MIQEARRVMVEEALGLARNNRTQASRILAVSRQSVQQAVRVGLASEPDSLGGEAGRRKLLKRSL